MAGYRRVHKFNAFSWPVLELLCSKQTHETSKTARFDASETQDPKDLTGSQAVTLNVTLCHEKSRKANPIALDAPHCCKSGISNLVDAISQRVQLIKMQI